MNQKLAQRYQTDGMAVLSRPQLVVRLYERLQRDLEQAAEAVDAGQIERSHTTLLHAQDIVHELSLALDADAWDGARELASVYDHLNRQLIEANLRKSSELIHECLDLVMPLVDAWRQALAITQTERTQTVSADNSSIPTGVTA